MKKIRLLAYGGVAHYAEGTPDAQGVQPYQESPGLMLAPEDTGKATDYLLAPYEQFAPYRPDVEIPMRRTEDVQIPYRPTEQLEPIDITKDDDFTLAKKMAARLKADGLSGMMSPEDQKKRSKYIEEQEKKLKEQQQNKEPPLTLDDPFFQNEKPVVTTLEEDQDKKLGLVEEDLPKEGQRSEVYSPKKPMTIYGQPPKTTEAKGVLDDVKQTYEGIKTNLKNLGEKTNQLFEPEKQTKQAEPTPPAGLMDDWNKTVQGIQTNLQDLTNKAARFFGVSEAPPQVATPGAPAAPGAGAPAVPDAAAAGQARRLPTEPAYVSQTKRGLELGAPPPPTATQVAGTGRPQDPMNMAMDAYEAMKQANLDIAQAQKSAAEDTAVRQLAAVTQLQNLEKNYNKQLELLNDENQKLQNDVMTQKIDPFRIYRKNNGNRILAGISILLGGLSQGLTGARTNPAWDTISEMLDRDIDGQKAELGRKQSLLSFNLAKYQRLDAATAATRAQLLSIVQAQINMAAAKSNSEIALKNAQMANAQIDLEKAKLLQSIAGQSVVQGVMQTDTGIPPQAVMRLPENVRELMVRVPSYKIDPQTGERKPGPDRFYPAINKETAQKVRDGLTAVGTVQSLLEKSQAIFNEVQKSTILGVRTPVTDEMKGQAKSLDGQFDIEIKNLAGLGVLTVSDLDLIAKMKPDPLAWTYRDQELGKYQALQNYIDSKVNNYLMNNIPNYNPGGIQQTTVMP